MPRHKFLLTALAALSLLLLPTHASGEVLIKIDDVSCSSVTVSGSGSSLPPNESFPVTVSDADTGAKEQSVDITTDAEGAFTADVTLDLQGIKNLQAEATVDGNIFSTILVLDESLLAECDSAPAVAGEDDKGEAGGNQLPFTGPGQTALFLGLGAALIVFGVVLRMRFAYRGRHDGAV